MTIEEMMAQPGAYREGDEVRIRVGPGPDDWVYPSTMPGARPYVDVANPL